MENSVKNSDKVIISKERFIELLKYEHFVESWHNNYEVCEKCGCLNPSGCVCSECGHDSSDDDIDEQDKIDIDWLVSEEYIDYIKQ